MNDFSSVIDRLVRVSGQPSRAALARFLGVRAQDLNNWARRGIPPSRVDEIERKLDYAMLKHEMRPDMFTPPPTAA